MVRHSEDWWGVLRQGIESEHMGLVRQSSVLLGGLRLGAVRLGAEIELENMGLERHGAERLGGSRPGLVSLGMEIELENMARAEQGWAGTGRVFIGRPRQGTEIELENMARHATVRRALVMSGSLGSELGKVRQVSARCGN